VIAQRFAARVVFSGTLFLAGWSIGLLGVWPEPSRAARIEEREPVGSTPPATADAELLDARQGNNESPERSVSLGLTVLPEVTTPDPTARGPGDASPDDVAAVHPERPNPTTMPAAMSISEVPKADQEFPETALAIPGPSDAERPVVNPPLPEARPLRTLASLPTSDPLNDDPLSIEAPSECPVPGTCIDDYLWSLYERAPKIDTNKVLQRIKVTVKRKGKTRTVVKTATKYVVGDFTWKDPIAAQRAGMSLKGYVIGGMEPGFKLKLYRALRAMDDAGLMPGITSAFRDDYRQSIASGNKAASDSSYHGGSRRGGYGYGLAADVVSVKGQTRSERYASSQELWKWIDANEKELGIGRPYLNRDPPHVAPIDGREYAAKRGRVFAQSGAKPDVARQSQSMQIAPSPISRSSIRRARSSI
jgi:hypothetical protein